MLPCAGIHQPRNLVIFLWELKGTPTVPYSRPSGRRILYASRTCSLTLSAETTITFLSEYSSTASVFSSWAGSGTLTSARIHSGASATAAWGAKARTQATHRTTVGSCQLLVRGRCAGLQDNLLFIARPHLLKEVPQRAVILGLQH